jgi:hypothetical protein
VRWFFAQTNVQKTVGPLFLFWIGWSMQQASHAAVPLKSPRILNCLLCVRSLPSHEHVGKGCVVNKSKNVVQHAHVVVRKNSTVYSSNIFIFMYAFPTEGAICVQTHILIHFYIPNVLPHLERLGA